MKYKIGSFNIRDFNFANEAKIEEDAIPLYKKVLYKDNDNVEKLKRNFSKIAEIIVNEHFDIVGVQEVNSENAIKYLIKKLKYKSYFEDWSYKYIPAYSKNGKRDPESYAYIYNKKKFVLVEEKKDNPRLYVEAGGNELIRPPYYARFTTRGLAGGSNFEIRLLNIHIRDSKDELERKKEFDTVVKKILPRCIEHASINSNNHVMPAYTFVLGDYNLCVSDNLSAKKYISSECESNYTGRKHYFINVQEEKSSLKIPNGQVCLEECYSENYDHFTYEKELDEFMYITVKRIEVLEKYYKSEPTYAEKLTMYRKEVSDHVPIVLEIDFNK